MTLARHSSRVIRRVVLPPDAPNWKSYWILLLPILMILFQLIPLGIPIPGVRPTLAGALTWAMAADLATVGVACLFVAGEPGNRFVRLGLTVPRRKRDLTLLPIIGGALSFAALTLADALYSILTGGQGPPPQAVAQALSNSPGLGLRMLAIAAVVLVAPFSEEIVFRGVSFRGLRRRLGFPLSAMVSACLFSMAHLDLPHAIQLIAVGTVLAWTTERSGSILPGMILHAGINLSSLVLIWKPDLLG
ncbi:MAG TPA: type II CAAX endopeptidase family protein [Planctomycetota bacterium]|nr:type II CAAX endopeptidase family protein [Planctomycetota bacterium]